MRTSRSTKSQTHARGATVVAALVSILASAGDAAAQEQFSFAGASFNQLYTPNTGASLAPGTYSGAIVTAVPSATGSFTGFPSSTTGFDTSRSIGRLLGGSSGTRFVNLPAGNNGTTARSGFELSWNDATTLGNAAGDDFVVYESASTNVGVEAFMVQVYVVETDTWSSWRYEPSDGFQPYNPLAPTGEGGTATLYDLSDFGVSAAQTVGKFRVVNMTDEDRMVDSSGYGAVLPEDNGATSTFLPNPGPTGGGPTTFPSSNLDPDPFYLGAVQCGDGDVDVETGEECDPGGDVAGDCCTAGCRYETDATACDDSDLCSGPDQCTAGICDGAPLDCDDGNDCTIDSCEAGTGCLNDSSTTDGSACEDGLFCTIDEVCSAGACSGAPRDCNDDSDCTADSCDDIGDACVNDGAPQEGAGCNLGLFCFSPGVCASGNCGGSTATDCADANQCTEDSCDEDSDACAHDGMALEGDSCDDGAFCTTPDTCQSGSCTGPANGCDDDNECTEDSCDEPGDACINDPVPLEGSSCGGAGTFCVGPGTCAAGSCNGAPTNCDDGSPCTLDSCDDDIPGCVHDGDDFEGTPCDDGEYCTIGDTCTAGVCNGTARDCADTNECTADSCDEVNDNCVQASGPADGMSCTDADPCTGGTTCSGGSCGGGSAVEVCSDTQVCGSEQCDDGDLEERDGCSSDCEIEHVESDAQQKCLTRLNSAGSKVAKAQAKTGVKCLKLALAGGVSDPQGCVTADEAGKVAKASGKTDVVESDSCTSPPNFGETDSTVINAAAVDGEVALLADVFGADIGAAAIDKATDPDGAGCQLAVAKAAIKLGNTERKEFVKCKKIGLGDQSIVSRATLRECLAIALDDSTGKPAKSRAKIDAAIFGNCAGVTLATALPGICASAPAVADCIADAVGCRVCSELNVIDALGASCCP